MGAAFHVGREQVLDTKKSLVTRQHALILQLTMMVLMLGIHNAVHDTAALACILDSYLVSAL